MVVNKFKRNSCFMVPVRILLISFMKAMKALIFGTVERDVGEEQYTLLKMHLIVTLTDIKRNKEFIKCSMQELKWENL